MRYRAIQEHDRRYPIRLMCRALAVSAAGYYAWRSRPESPRSIYARTLFSAIRVIHQESRETYDSPSIWNALVKQGHRIGEHRVARLMRQAGLRAKTVKKWRATTQSQHPFPVAANTLDRTFTDPSLKTRPRGAGNSMPPAARFEPPVRQIPGVLSSQANHAAGAHCSRSATLQSSVGHHAARRTPARSDIRLESAH